MPDPDKPAHLLIVDDDPTLLKTATLMLNALGYTVETASSGKQGLSLLAENADRFDFVLTDYSMPDMDGREMVREAHKMGAMPPFIVVSGYVLEDDDLQNDFTAYLLKPFRMKDLTDTLTKLLNS
ncbi:MAG: response regulator [bacterium]